MSLRMAVRTVAVVQEREHGLLLEQTFLPTVRKKDALVYNK